MQPDRPDRRLFLQATALLAAIPVAARAASAAPIDLSAACKAIEQASGGRYGLAVHDVASGRRFNWRGGDRFAMASTFKFLLAAHVLARVDHGEESLNRPIAVGSGDIIANSPFAQSRAGKSATIAELCNAMMIYSDNAAANLLLPTVGGPAGLTQFLRRIGDRVTRLDRNEPMMSEDRPGEVRDTTSPGAMLATMENILAGTVLSQASRQRLTDWMIANTTGNTRLRAGLPAGWRAGDKTGSSSANSANDIAIIWRPGVAQPLYVASFLNRAKADYARLGIYHADLARALVKALT